jgi:hypothetical protein
MAVSQVLPAGIEKTVLRIALRAVFADRADSGRVVGRVESRAPRAENKPVTAGTFINFRGPQALKDKQETGD